MKARRWKVVSLVVAVTIAAFALGYAFIRYTFRPQHPVTAQHVQGTFRVWRQNAHGVLKEINVDPQSEFHREFAV